MLDQLTTVWLTAHGHGHTGGPPEDRPDGPAGKPRGRPRRPATPRSPAGHGTSGKTTRTAAAGRPPGRNGADATRTAGPGRTADARRTPAGKPRREPASRPHRPRPGPRPRPSGHVPGPGTGHGPGPGEVPAAAGDRDCAIAGCLEATRRRLQATILRWSLDLLSGPGGLASQLRGTLLGAPFSTPSQPLDLGRATRTIPPHLRTAVIQRDQHCQFPGCTQPPSVCDVHHLIPWAKGGPTSLANLRLFCRFHHLIVIHQWGWTITCHPDGTTTATAPDGRTLHSHGPPQQAA